MISQQIISDNLLLFRLHSGRHITIPVERLDENTFVYGIGFDGSNYGYAPIEKSDMVFLPDPDTAFVGRFAEGPTLTMVQIRLLRSYPTSWGAAT